MLFRSTAGTADVERIIEGDAPVALNDQALMVPLPGHTAGSMALLYRERFLFSGDHAWWDPARGEMVASRDVCWHDWNMQMASQARLASLRFEWLLPGHGSRGQADVEAMQAAARRCEARMRDGNGSA